MRKKEENIHNVQDKGFNILEDDENMIKSKRQSKQENDLHKIENNIEKNNKALDDQEKVLHNKTENDQLIESKKLDNHRTLDTTPMYRAKINNNLKDNPIDQDKFIDQDKQAENDKTMNQYIPMNQKYIYQKGNTISSLKKTFYQKKSTEDFQVSSPDHRMVKVSATITEASKNKKLSIPFKIDYSKVSITKKRVFTY